MLHLSDIDRNFCQHRETCGKDWLKEGKVLNDKREIWLAFTINAKDRITTWSPFPPAFHHCSLSFQLRPPRSDLVPGPGTGFCWYPSKKFAHCARAWALFCGRCIHFLTNLGSPQDFFPVVCDHGRFRAPEHQVWTGHKSQGRLFLPSSKPEERRRTTCRRGNSCCKRDASSL